MTYENLTEANARVQALESDLVAMRTGIAHAAAALACQHLGENGPLFAGYVAGCLRPHVNKEGKFSLQVLDAEGKVRFSRSSDGRIARTMDVGEFVAAIPTDPKFKQFFVDGVDAAKATQGRSETGITQAMRAMAKQAEPGAALTQAERDAARCKNPWAKNTRNVTEQMQLTARDPSFAAELRDAAGA